MSGYGFEPAGTDGDLTRMKGSAQEGKHRAWALVGDDAAIQFNLRQLPSELIDMATPDYGLHGRVQRGYPGSYACELLGGWCQFMPYGPTGEVIWSRARRDIAAGVAEDDAIFAAMRGVWDELPEEIRG